MKTKYLLLFLLFSTSSYAQVLSLPCPDKMIGPENLLIMHLKTSLGSKRIEGPASIRFDECRVDFTEEGIIPYLKVKVKTNAKFIFKKKILFAKVTKVIDLKCSFKSTVNTKVLKDCNLKNTSFGLYRLKCRGIPPIFTKIVEKLIKKEIRKKGGRLIERMFSKLIAKNEFLQELCSIEKKGES
ncbi:MAG: hypothetical protein DRQ88_03425 [Epsilonproteobacteria bacterium]|nr:MAG: hypothetical protein DRQ89_01335 [Campylobacterota bacterium]RLA67370.1 MAG: hypothetical protein DRQ88_03425 [Campylobacterota bacterium]